MTHGEVGITEISSVDWHAIGERWAEQASQGCLMHADKPCTQQVQACQILALFWFARSQTLRTGMHASRPLNAPSVLEIYLADLPKAIAYRSCLLLNYEKVTRETMNIHSTGQVLQLRCFWASWLTQCTAQRDSTFRIDCWADAANCPLPLDKDQNPQGYIHYLDESGAVRDFGEMGRKGRWASVRHQLSYKVFGKFLSPLSYPDSD